MDGSTEAEEGKELISNYEYHKDGIKLIVTYCIISCSGYKAGKRQRNIDCCPKGKHHLGSSFFAKS